ncbi:sulfotransferase [Nocardia sp. BMG111209]|uniref:sulfotransferase family protein n=1 Tax=Nocardia sp. BMG111209 TaxID=1160137 RepID=UPI00036D97A0|nr:sulfotransferase [Nocardia sp. BMG111209]
MAIHDDLLTEARSRTGLDDFGDDSYREGLERLLRALRTEAKLNATGTAFLHRMLLEQLSQRLQVEDWYRRHPEIEDESITALIGLGLPRTGSTALSQLLGADPNARSLRQWQAGHPCPPPSTVSGADPRLGLTAAEGEERDRQSPRRRKLVPSSTTGDGPAECHDLMALDFKSHYYQAFARIPSYSHWFAHEADLTSTYRYELRVLKLLQWGLPAQPWRLKCPTHLLFLDQLDEVFPDAKFVQTHRDPTEVMVSAADLYVTIASVYSDDVDPAYMAALNLEHWTLGIRRGLAFRDRAGDDRFHDIDFRAMQRDPIGEITRLYAWLGEPITDEFAAGMRHWWHENAENREANVHPDPTAFGLDFDEVRPLFADYVARAAAWTAPTDKE